MFFVAFSLGKWRFADPFARVIRKLLYIRHLHFRAILILLCGLRLHIEAILKLLTFKNLILNYTNVANSALKGISNRYSYRYISCFLRRLPLKNDDSVAYGKTKIGHFLGDWIAIFQGQSRIKRRKKTWDVTLRITGANVRFRTILKIPLNRIYGPWYVNF